MSEILSLQEISIRLTDAILKNKELEYIDLIVVYGPYSNNTAKIENEINICIVDPFFLDEECLKIEKLFASILNKPVKVLKVEENHSKEELISYGKILSESVVVFDRDEATKNKVDILTVEDIKQAIIEVIKECPEYTDLPTLKLFGSYANGTATETSDINLCMLDIPDKYSLLKIVGFERDLSKKLDKVVHLLRIDDAKNENKPLYDIVLNTGFVIYTN